MKRTQTYENYTRKTSCTCLTPKVDVRQARILFRPLLCAARILRCENNCHESKSDAAVKSKFPLRRLEQQGDAKLHNANPHLFKF